MSRKHYHVNTFLPGCLNDGSIGPFTSKKDAVSCASQEASEVAEAYNGRKSGSNGRYEVEYGADFGCVVIISVEECDATMASCISRE
jgi:hypothetical protein